MAKCKACGAEIIFKKTRFGKSMPVDEKPVAYYKGDKDKIVTEDVEVILCNLDGNSDEFLGFGYVPHFATCPAAERFRRRKNG